MAAVELADRLCRKVFHLVVTCDSKVNLAMMNSHNPMYVHVLPPESNDQSLAMTGSYSGMLLSGLLIASLPELSSFESRVNKLHVYGNTIITGYSQLLRQIADMPFTRAVFLGSGPFFGTITESSLKLQELTDGRILCKSESFLGLRHGPKAVIDNETLLFYIFSSDPYVLNYERDLANSMRKGNNPLITIGLSEKPVPGCSTDAFIGLSNSGIIGDDELLTVCNILPGQLLGFYKSLALGLKPDNPSVNGSISRVVENVKIYRFGQQE
jgi:tagatose-6-phosphate ketose/aldose isomerase